MNKEAIIMLNIHSVFSKINPVWLLVPLMGIYVVGCTPIYTTTVPSTIDTTVGDRTYYNRGMGYTHYIPFSQFIYHDDVRNKAVLHKGKVQSRTTKRKTQKVQKAQIRRAYNRKSATPPPQSTPKSVLPPISNAPSSVNRKVVPYQASLQPARNAQQDRKIAPRRAEPRRAVKRTPRHTENRKESQPAKRSAKRRQAQRRN